MYAVDRMKDIAASEALIGLHQIKFFRLQQFTGRLRKAAITSRRCEIARVDDFVRDSGIGTLRPCAGDDGRLRTLRNQCLGSTVEETLSAAEGVVPGADEGEFHALANASAKEGGNDFCICWQAAKVCYRTQREPGS